MLVIGRIARLAVLIDDLLRPPFAAAGLANGDFDLLAALRRQGPPYEASPGELAAAMLVTTGATTKRIDRLERQGYVTRQPTDATAGGRVVALTASRPPPRRRPDRRPPRQRGGDPAAARRVDTRRARSPARPAGRDDRRRRRSLIRPERPGRRALYVRPVAPTTPTAHGGCGCGAVTYVVTGPLRDVYDCHCERCRKFTGHHMAATAAHPDAVAVSDTAGHLAWYSPVPRVHYGFCRRCGSSLFWRTDDRPDSVSICAGTLAIPTGLRTTQAWWLAESSDYVRRDPSLQGFDHEE